MIRRPPRSTLSLHDALPISSRRRPRRRSAGAAPRACAAPPRRDRKSTRLNSSHLGISYAVFCLKKKKKQKSTRTRTQHTKRRRDSNIQRRGGERRSVHVQGV